MIFLDSGDQRSFEARSIDVKDTPRQARLLREASSCPSIGKFGIFALAPHTMTTPYDFSLDDPWARRWSRRAISMGICALMIAALIVTFPGLLLLSLLADLVRRANLASTRTLLFVALYLYSEAYGVIGAIALWILHRVLRQGSQEDFVAWNYALQWRWAHLLVGTSSRIFKLNWEIDADPGRGAGPALIFMQHSSLGDTLLPIHLLSFPYGLRLRYVLKRELLWDPSIDVVGQRLANFFVDRNSRKRVSQINALRSMVSNLKHNEAALIYPEGTRGTSEKRAHILETLQRAGNAQKIAYAQSLQWLLPPRMGGAIAFLESAPKADVLFCAHSGFEGTARLSDIWHGKIVGQTVRLKFWRVPHADVPREPPRQRQWFLEQWSKMDVWLQQQKSLSNE
jgi:1-acyl-sn-glycerol-3-phosphate acyltransferase